MELLSRRKKANHEFNFEKCKISFFFAARIRSLKRRKELAHKEMASFSNSDSKYS